MVINMDVTVNRGDDLITHRIVRGDRRPDVHIFILVALVVAECRRVDRDVITQLVIAKRNDLAGIDAPINLQGDHIVNFRIPPDGTGDDLLCHIQLRMVQHIVARHLINGDARLSVQIDMHNLVMRCRVGVAVIVDG